MFFDKYLGTTERPMIELCGPAALLDGPGAYAAPAVESNCSSPGRTASLIAALLVLLATFLVYRPVIDFEFVTHDDPLHIYDNPFVSDPSFEHALHFWKEPYFGLYIPATYSVWVLQANFAKVAVKPGDSSPSYARFDPAVFHGFNLVFHLLNVLIVFLILNRLAKGPWTAAAGTLLFALHPVQVESVAWVSEFKGLLAAFFMLLATLLHLFRFGQANNRGRIIAGCSLLCFLLALLSKPSAVALPFLLATIDLLVLRRSCRDVLFDSLPWMALLIPFALIARYAQPESTLTFIPPIYLRPIVAIDAISFYFRKLFIPLGLCLDYGRTPQSVLASGTHLISYIPTITACLAVLMLRRHMQRLLASMALFVVGFLPVLGFIPFSHQYISTVADRYMYMPLLGPALGLALLLALLRKSWIALCVAICITVVLSSMTSRQLSVWRNYEPLYENTVRLNPRSSLALSKLANIRALESRSVEAVKLYRAALVVDPNYAVAREGLGITYGNLGRFNEAAKQLAIAAHLGLDSPLLQFRLGFCFLQVAKYQEAIDHLRNALALQPDFPQAAAALKQAEEGLVVNQ